jgi:ribulose-5-phosphate 4-epimerase/fuculose-1-phosphate aldolase
MDCDFTWGNVSGIDRAEKLSSLTQWDRFNKLSVDDLVTVDLEVILLTENGNLQPPATHWRFIATS